jgi:hypothetical protein
MEGLMTQTTINRRRALAVVAAVPAAVAVGSTALASTGEDTKLLRLWEEWKAQLARLGQANKAYNDVQEKVWGELEPHWQPAGVNIGSPFAAVFSSPRFDGPKFKTVALKAKDMSDVYSEARKVKADLDAERKRAERNAKRRYGYGAAKRADDHEGDKLQEIEEAIAATPAEGLRGAMVKLALWRFWEDAHSDVHNDSVTSAYDTLVTLTGLPDLAAQVERW